MKSYFIIGTDTDCGKTYVTSEIASYLLKHNYLIKALKPVASGCKIENGQKISEDALILSKYANNDDEICPWKLTMPVSPHLAAKNDGIELSSKEIINFCTSSKFKNLDYLLIEGAGGLFVPLNSSETWVDILKIIKIPVILVVGMKLGCINHALLTAFALNQNQIPFAGWVANCIDKDMLCLKENIETLIAGINKPLLGVVPFNGKIEIINSIF
jgi:dethiobiotin synthetase